MSGGHLFSNDRSEAKTAGNLDFMGFPVFFYANNEENRVFTRRFDEYRDNHENLFLMIVYDKKTEKPP